MVEQVLVTGVGLRSGRETGVLTHGPDPASIHRPVDAPGEGKRARVTEVVVVAARRSRAATGGSYSHTGSGTAFAVTGGAGTVTLRSAKTVYGAYLNAVKIASVDLSVSVSSDKPASGYRQAVYLVARRVRSNTEYRIRVQATTSQVWLQLQKVVDAKSTSLGKPVGLPGISYVAGKTLRLRLLATGTAPTSLRVKAWPADTSEPGDWQLTRSDTQTAL